VLPTRKEFEAAKSEIRKINKKAENSVATINKAYEGLKEQQKKSHDIYG
jgi:hypothetical protein